jgi:AcrR family transcriptional regulator
MSKDVKQKSLTAPDLRAKRVARTEAQLIEAASVLFCDQGYVATTLAQIAERAGVAARTVYVRFGTKAALFSRVIDQALVGDAEPVDVAHRPRAHDAMTADTLAERIEALAAHLSGLGEAHAGVHFATIGWILPMLHDPDGHEVRFYSVESHTELDPAVPLVIDDAVATAQAKEERWRADRAASSDVTGVAP